MIVPYNTPDSLHNARKKRAIELHQWSWLERIPCWNHHQSKLDSLSHWFPRSCSSLQLQVPSLTKSTSTHLLDLGSSNHHYNLSSVCLPQPLMELSRVFLLRFLVLCSVLLALHYLHILWFYPFALAKSKLHLSTLSSGVCNCTYLTQKKSWFPPLIDKALVMPAPTHNQYFSIATYERLSEGAPGVYHAVQGLRLTSWVFTKHRGRQRFTLLVTSSSYFR